MKILAAIATLCVLSYVAFAAAPINVHVVCHTHDDVGWLKTVDEYYLGANNSIQHAGVQYILDSVIPQLVANPARKFIYVEIGFFSRWWVEQTAAIQDQVKTLVANGQLEFINGGWCMNDEATTHYVDIVDQMTLGHAFIKENFGVSPRIGWHIDPFGHSSVQATLFAQMGFDGFFFGRADYIDKNTREQLKTMEVLWRGSPSLGKAQELFTGLNFNGYGPPDSFCFDQFCDDQPINDDPRLYNNDLPQRAQDFVKWCQWQNSYYRSNNILLTMGSDFQYENANLWFKNLDKLINYFAVHPELGLNVFYSTPSMYVDAIYKTNLTWSVKTDDYFPYADGPHAFWTGYFVSRPALKGYVREMSSYLQTCRQAESFGLNSGSSLSSYNLWQAMGIAQHHDAVAGTEKQHVAFDYALRLGSGENDCASILNNAFSTLVNANNQSAPTFTQCPLINESNCDATKNFGSSQQTLAVLIYNSIASARGFNVKVPVSSNGSFSVQDAGGNSVNSQVLNFGPAITGQSQKYTLVFQAQLPALGYATYFISAAGEEEILIKELEAVLDEPADPNSISNEHYSIAFDPSTGLMTSITSKDTGQTVGATQQLLWWNSSCGTPEDGQASGAYIFRPNGTDPHQIGSPELTVSVGSVVQEVRQVFANWAQQTIRLWAGSNYIEYEYHIGPIPIGDGQGKEIVSRFSTDIASASTWYTDANGREMRERIRDHRFDWTYNNTEPASGNYYPVNSAMYLQDSAGESRLTIVTDRSQAGTSLHDGELEVMIHRRTLCDDGRGVGEPINEPGYDGLGLVIHARHFVVLNSGTASPDIQRRVEQHQTFRPVVAFAQVPNGDINAWRSSYRTSWSASNVALPPNIHLLTVQQWPDASTYLLRLAHMFEVNESPDLSGNATVDLTQIFQSSVIQVESAVELSLSANQDLSDVHRLVWNSDSDANAAPRYVQQPIEKVLNADGTFAINVNIAPQEIRTFQVTVSQL